MTMIHHLKTLPHFFDAIRTGVKPFEIRETNDRKFAVGDILFLQWFDPLVGYNGHFLIRRVSYMTDFGQKPNTVVLGLSADLSGKFVDMNLLIANNYLTTNQESPGIAVPQEPSLQAKHLPGQVIPMIPCYSLSMLEKALRCVTIVEGNMIVIFNPESGPSSKPDPSIQKKIKELKREGVCVLAYIDTVRGPNHSPFFNNKGTLIYPTSTSRKDSEMLVREIKKYSSSYTGIDGIFFDDCTQRLEYVFEACEAERVSTETCVVNPGYPEHEIDNSRWLSVVSFEDAKIPDNRAGPNEAALVPCAKNLKARSIKAIKRLGFTYGFVASHKKTWQSPDVDMAKTIKELYAHT